MLHDWNEFDETLKAVALVEIKLADAEQDRKDNILAIEAAVKKVTEPLKKRKTELEGELESFFKANRKKVEADGKRSIELTFGRAGMRKGPKALALMKGWKWEKVLATAKEQWKRKTDLLAALINTKESVNKEVVKARLSEEEMALIGLKLKQEDEFFYETYPEKVKPAA